MSEEMKVFTLPNLQQYDPLIKEYFRDMVKQVTMTNVVYHEEDQILEFTESVYSE